MQIIIDTANTSITVKNKCFLIANKTTSRQISPKQISSIAITSNCNLNSSAIQLAAREQVPLLFFILGSGILSHGILGQVLPQMETYMQHSSYMTQQLACKRYSL